MTIIQLDEVNGLRRIMTWHTGIYSVPDGWALVPDTMVQSAFSSCGFCDIETEMQEVDGKIIAVLTKLTATEKPKFEAPKDSMTLEDILAENERLQRQLTAQEMRGDFIEECLLELSETVYA